LYFFFEFIQSMQVVGQLGQHMNITHDHRLTILFGRLRIIDGFDIMELFQAFDAGFYGYIVFTLFNHSGFMATALFGGAWHFILLGDP
jgi:hypothetical protein